MSPLLPEFSTTCYCFLTKGSYNFLKYNLHIPNCVTVNAVFNNCMSNYINIIFAATYPVYRTLESGEQSCAIDHSNSLLSFYWSFLVTRCKSKIRRMQFLCLDYNPKGQFSYQVAKLERGHYRKQCHVIYILETHNFKKNVWL